MCRLRRTVCESVGERWRDRAGSLRTVGIRSHRWLHTCWHGRSARPMAPPPRSGGGSEPAAGHSRRECGRAMARPRFRRTRDVCMKECMFKCNVHFRMSLRVRPYERLHEDPESPARVFLKDDFLDGFGGLSVNVKHVPRAVYARTPVGHFHLVQRITNLASGVEGPRTPFGELVRMTAREMNAGAI